MGVWLIKELGRTLSVITGLKLCFLNICYVTACTVVFFGVNCCDFPL